MSSHVLVMCVSVLIGADTAFEGTNAGEARELAPGIAFRWCPPGSLSMGGLKPGGRGFSDDDEYDYQLTVSLSSGFWLGETEVTQGQWTKLMKTAPWKTVTPKRGMTVKEGSDYPASCISHGDAVTFCEKLTAQEQYAGRLPKNHRYTLPTEAQWEYACRAGTTTRFPFGNDESRMGEYAWFQINADDLKETFAHRVALKRPNAWGLRDMQGNVWERCRDWFDERLPGGRDPVGPASGLHRVCRGGCWYSDSDSCQPAYRIRCNPESRLEGLGFRLAAVPATGDS